MSRRATRVPAPVRPIGIQLPADWRHRANWRVWAMLANIDQAEYEIVASEFERRHADVLRDDWTVEWRKWCRAILIERSARVELIEGLF